MAPYLVQMTLPGALLLGGLEVDLVVHLVPVQDVRHNLNIPRLESPDILVSHWPELCHVV